MKTHYEVLGVGQGASPDEIRSAYKARIREVHPDVFQGASSEATERAIELNGAYAVLSDPEKRALYDRMLHPKVHAEPSAARAAAPSPYAPQETWAVPQYFRRNEDWTAYADSWADRPAPDWTQPGNGRNRSFLEDMASLSGADKVWVPPSDEADEAEAPKKPLSAEEEWAAYADSWSNHSEQEVSSAAAFLQWAAVAIFVLVLAALWVGFSPKPHDSHAEKVGLAFLVHITLGPVCLYRLMKGGKKETIQGFIYLAVISVISLLLFRA